MEREGQGAGLGAAEAESGAEAEREVDVTTPEEAERDGAENLLELVLAEHAARASAMPERIDGVMIGRLAALEASGDARVVFPGSPADGLPARSMAALSEADLGCEIALLFEAGDPRRPVVMGLMHGAARPATRPEAKVDSERIEFTAEKEIVLRCGNASITLTRAGKILIRGAYVLTRSSGVNRIQGGSVQIN
jgi:hypothetical protein